MKPGKMGSVYQPSYKDRKTGELKKAATWSVRYWNHGRMIQEQTHSTKRSDAVRMLKDRIAKMAQGRPVGPDVEKTTIKALSVMVLTDYRINGRRSLSRVKRSVDHLLAFFGEEARSADVTEDVIARYIDKRKETDKAENATINRDLAILRRMFRLGERTQKVGRRPYIEMLVERNVRKGFVERAELNGIVHNLTEDLRPVVEVAYITGWRVASEILTREWKHVDFAGGFLRLEPGETKNGEGRMFPLTPGLRAVLERQRERTSALERATGRILPCVFHRNGKPVRSFRGAWQKACEKAGAVGRIPHDFRRTAVRNLERAGVPRSAAMNMVGHKTESIYRRYAIVDEAMMREGAEKLGTFHDAERKKAAEAAARAASGPRIVSIIEGRKE